MNNFNCLSSFEFECLVRDLMKKHLNKHFEMFSSGPDMGIDALHSTKEFKYAIVVQSKHYINSSFERLLKELEREELPKVINLGPERYIIAVSQKLTPSRKEKILQIFKGFIHKTADIFGIEDLQSLLRDYPEVSKNNYKLWLSSISSLEMYLNVGVIGRSRLTEKGIFERIRLFTENNVTRSLRKKLRKKRVIIISGPPGIGKTTAAELTSFHYMKKGYVLRNVCTVEELENVVFAMGDQKTLVFFDDFIGSNTVDFIQGREDSRLYHAIESVLHSKRMKLLMTVRMSIEKQAFLISEKLSRMLSGLHHEYLNNNSYSYEDKALMLYNHLDARITRRDFRDYIKERQRYLLLIPEIATPRAIDNLTMPGSYNGKTPQTYFDYVYRTLMRPSYFWQENIKKSLNGHEKLILRAVFYFGGVLNQDDLYNFETSLSVEQIENTIEVLNETYIKKVMNGQDEIIISFMNPSIGDYFINEAQKTRRSRLELIRGLGKSKNLSLIVSNPKMFQGQEEVEKAWTLVKDLKYKLPLPSRISFGAFISKNVDCEADVLTWLKDACLDNIGALLGLFRHTHSALEVWTGVNTFFEEKKDDLFRTYVLNSFDISDFEDFDRYLILLGSGLKNYLLELDDYEDVIQEIESSLEAGFDRIKESVDEYESVNQEILDDIEQELEHFSEAFSDLFDGLIGNMFDTNLYLSDYEHLDDEEVEVDDDEIEDEEKTKHGKTSLVHEIFKLL